VTVQVLLSIVGVVIVAAVLYDLFSAMHPAPKR
jgi:hypothetical protein